jgi:hypothetical protein
MVDALGYVFSKYRCGLWTHISAFTFGSGYLDKDLGRSGALDVAGGTILAIYSILNGVGRLFGPGFPMESAGRMYL